PLPKGMRDGLFDFRIGKDVTVLLGSGLGGGSLINAGVAEPADAAVFARWPSQIREEWQGQAPAFQRYYDQAREMLEARPVPLDQNLAKRTQFENFARAANLAVAPAHITVTYQSGLNHHGVQQEACV